MHDLIILSDYGPEVSYSKNWVFPSDLLWYDRWNQILALRPQFVEIVTWNDYGESHYVSKPTSYACLILTSVHRLDR
jgi:hypothetical protein